MSDALKELLWMVGCTSVMGAVGLVALIGYARLRKSENDAPSSATD